MLTPADKLVIAFYFLFMLGIAWVFKRFIRNTSDYFRGGGEMLWWLAGAGAFTVGFSAVTFTGMAGKAFTDGPVVIVIFLGNALGFVINYFWFAPTCRQTRAVTSMQVVRARFGRASEQFFMWLQIPVSVISAGLHLTGLCVFVSAAFALPLNTTIFATGTVVLVMALLGGSWSVMAGDFVQMLVLMPVTIVAAVLSLHYVGGVDVFVGHAPRAFWHWSDSGSSAIITLWVVATLLQKFVSNNSMQDANRYLSVKDSAHARKAAVLGFVLFLIGPAVWFIPPMCARIALPNLGAVFPQLPEAKVRDAAYFAMSVKALPAGMTGLVLSVIFGATMSSVDGGLNKNAGFFVKNFYQPLLKPGAPERHLMIVSKVATVVLGFLIMGSALISANFKELSIFEMTTFLGGLVSLPVAIPLVLGLIFRRAPSWAGWSTVLVGLTTSVIVILAFSAEKVQHLAGWHFNKREASDYTFLAGSFANIGVECLYFWVVSLMFRLPDAAPSAEIASKPAELFELPEPERVQRFFEMIQTPVNFEAEETGGGSDNAQAKIMGILSLIYGCFVAALSLLPNPGLGRLAFVACGLTMLTVGTLLYRVGTKHSRAAKQHKLVEPAF